MTKKSFKNIRERAVEYGEALCSFIEAVTGKKDIKTKVQVLTNPDNPKSMSVLSSAQCRFVSISHFLAGVGEWDGLFDGMKDYSTELMTVSPSEAGLGREQVIRFAGAITESQLAKSLRIGVGGEKEAEREE